MFIDKFDFDLCRYVYTPDLAYILAGFWDKAINYSVVDFGSRLSADFITNPAYVAAGLWIKGNHFIVNLGLRFSADL
jgi:hypothetical protein